MQEDQWVVHESEDLETEAGLVRAPVLQQLRVCVGDRTAARPGLVARSGDSRTPILASGPVPWALAFLTWD